MDQFTRRIIGFGVHSGDVDGVALCRMFNTAISTRGAPKYLSSDNDPLFQYHQWQANLRILDVDVLKSIPFTPCSHPVIERLTGTIRREFPGHTLFWNAGDLEKILTGFQKYYNHRRTHDSPGGDTPVEFAGKTNKLQTTLNNFHRQTHYQGLYPLPVAA
jgi:putative transposase